MEIKEFTIKELNKELIELPALIAMKSTEVNNLREIWLIKKEDHENAYDLAFMSFKAIHEDATQKEIDIQAKSAAHRQRMEVIKAESAMRKADNELIQLRDRLGSIKQIANNLRAEIKAHLNDMGG